LPIENVGKTIKLWYLPCVVSLSVMLYTTNLLHTYRFGNDSMATTRNPLSKIGISHNFFYCCLYSEFYLS